MFLTFFSCKINIQSVQKLNAIISCNLNQTQTFISMRRLLLFGFSKRMKLWSSHSYPDHHGAHKIH